MATHEHAKRVSTITLAAGAKNRVDCFSLQAERDLHLELIAFFDRMRANGEKMLGRNPDSYDLLPFFDKYARTVFDAYVHELQPLPRSSGERFQRFQDAQLWVIEKVCRRNGIWTNALQTVALAVGLGSWRTRYGIYDVKRFSRPLRIQLIKRLGVHAIHWEVGFQRGDLEKTRAKNNSRPLFPNRAKWLREELDKRDWSFDQLHHFGGPDRGTTAKIMRGEEVTRRILSKVAKALRVNQKAIPND